MDNLKLIKTDLLDDYLTYTKGIATKFEALKDAEISSDSFSFYVSVASVFSSKIEGEDIALDSYIKHKAMGMSFQPDYTKKTDDLYAAYIFAQQHELTIENIREAHKLLSRNIVESSKQGAFRHQNMYVTTDDGRIEYVAAVPESVITEMEKWNSDVVNLLKINLSHEEVFFYAAWLHLNFVKIHPWHDGNGRSARLLEKWFIAQKLGPKAWFLQSEKNYYLHHSLYYQNLRRLGLEYEHLDYSRALPFLLMLPQCFTI